MEIDDNMNCKDSTIIKIALPLSENDIAIETLDCNSFSNHDVDQSKRVTKKYRCTICEKGLATRFSVRRHLRTSHNIVPPLFSRSKIKCLNCKDIYFHSVDKLRKHLSIQHAFRTRQENITFPTLCEFLKWKNTIEEQTLSHFVSVESRTIYKGEMHYYKCQESDTYGKHKKSLDSCAILEKTCTAYMKVFEFKNEVEVIFSKDHYGHTDDAQNLQLNEKDNNVDTVIPNEEPTDNDGSLQASSNSDSNCKGVSKNKEYKCIICWKKFKYSANHYRHIRDFHKLSSNNIMKTSVKCLNCESLDFTSITKLQKHLNEQHNYKMIPERHLFDSMNDFFTWKSKMEEQTNIHYVRTHGSRKIFKFTVHTFRCHRSGAYRFKGIGLRQSSSCKTGIACTSYLKVFEGKRKVEVLFLKEHYGHENDGKSSKSYRKKKEERSE